MISRKTKILVVIVSYNSEKWIRKNLASIGSEADILVLDNGSKDNTVTIIRQEFPNARLIVNEDNLGFAAANNIGFEIAKEEDYDWVFLVNHDAWLDEKCIGILKEATCKTINKKFGILTPTHLAGNMVDYDHGFLRYCDISRLRGEQLDDVLEITSINGAFLMISVECLKRIKGFDPIFFFYGEDIDLCIRTKKAGYKIGWVPSAIAYHDRLERPMTEQRLYWHVIANHLIQIKSMEDKKFYRRFLKSIASSIMLFFTSLIGRKFLLSYQYLKLTRYFIKNYQNIKHSVYNTN